MTNRLQSAIDAATSLHNAGASNSEIIEAARKVLAGAGEFGKSLDRSVRRVVLEVTGEVMAPGDGHGAARPDGSINYRG